MICGDLDVGKVYGTDASRFGLGNFGNFGIVGIVGSEGVVGLIHSVLVGIRGAGGRLGGAPRVSV